MTQRSIRFSGLSAKIGIAVAVVMLAAGGVFLFLAHKTGYRMLERQAYTRADGIAGLMKSILDHLMLEGRHDKLPVLIETATLSPEIADVIILNSEGKVLLDAKDGKVDAKFPMQELKNMRGRKGGKYMSFMEGDSSYLVIASPLEAKAACYTCHHDPSVVQGYLAVKVGFNDLRAASRQHRSTNIIMISLIFIGTGGVLFLALAYLVVRPIRKLRTHLQFVESVVGKTESADAGQLPELEVPKGKDEIATLCRGFNELIIRLNGAHQRIFELHQNQLQQADKLVTTGEMAASIAHEIKNPLTGILGALQVLDVDIPAADPKKQILAEMVAQLNRMNQAINDLLSYARPKAPNFESVNVNEIIQRTLSLLTHQVDANRISVRLLLDAQLPAILGDLQLLQQVLWNACRNALDAMSGKGELTIRTTKDNDSILIQVQDTGCGIPEADLQSIFKPFFTTKHKGTGLGLAISKRIVDEHRGSISVESAVGKGTSVNIKIPLGLGRRAWNAE